MVVVREGRSAAVRTRDEWQRRRAGARHEPGRQPGRESSAQSSGFAYQDWFCRLPADPSILAVQRQWFEEWPRPRRVWGVVVDDGGDVAASEASLRNQSWGLVEVVKAEPGGLADEFTRLSQEHPDDLVVMLRAGDRLRADAAYQMAQAAWRDPWLELVYWDDDLSDLADVWDWYLDGRPEGVYSGSDLAKIGDPRIKPGWSPDLLGCANYIGRAFAVRARRLGPETALRHQGAGSDDDALWWDVLLGLDVGEQQVCRLPAVLQALSRRCDQVEPHHRELVDRWLARHRWPARAEAGPNGIHLTWSPDRTAQVSVIIASRHNREMLAGALALIRSAGHLGLELVIADNGGRSEENEGWYEAHAADLSPQIIWWDEPFNYSAVNNRAAAQATGDVLVFLNDDTSPGHPQWLHNIIGWAQRPEIGVAGLQLIDDDGLIQHGGVVIGMTGLAGHLFQGMAPHSDSLLGSTDWTRNTVSVTGACLAVRRAVFEEVGGFDERLELCGSDVVLGLRARQAGYRNVVSPATPITHKEAATRGAHVPEGDVFASYWPYQRWLMGGDPYFSPNLSAAHPEPVLHCEEEPGVLKQLAQMLGRQMEVFYQRNEAGEAHALALVSKADRGLAEAVRQGHRAVGRRREVGTVNWFVPEFQNPFYGGIHTVFRLADHLAAHHGVENRFMVMAGPVDHDERWYRSGISAAFASLADSPIAYHDSFAFDPGEVPPADAAIATMWTTAYFAARTPGQVRRFYLIQDFEPMFYPAGTLYALAEHSYRLGLYGLCNTGHLADMYQDGYDGVARHFWPAVDGSVFHARGRIEPDPDRPVTVFIYARPGHLRNCWELAARAVRLVKDELADGVRIVTAGSWAFPEHMDALITHMGQLDYRETGPLYRTCDIGVALTTSEHPSYLPLELMACGAAVVSFENPAGDWLLRHDHNCMQSPQTADGLAAEIVALARDPDRRRRLAEQGLADIAARHARWDQNLAGVYDYLCDPEPGHD
ncbi:glycosyltransferase [Candidatus Poriferisocius sp.]|uniref:rhamnosyltransferase WsaF family glycosyltransferase n=1 Tax=Candidatus Poriferisocius sp. TaxID=3101276 RepID=UPI003B021CD4